MIFSDATIRLHCANGDANDLIYPFDKGALLNSSYQLHADRAFLPESGNEAVAGSGHPLCWTIDPGQALVIKTLEHVSLPASVVGMYTQLNRWAVRGLSLMNASLIEPLYHGPLSCQLVNFSRYPIQLPRSAVVSKITFHTLDAPTSRGAKEAIADYDYDVRLCESASVHPASFLDIGKLETRIREQLEVKARQWLLTPGIILAFLIAAAAVEPWITNFVYNHSGISMDANMRELSELRDEFRTAAAVGELRAETSRLQQGLDAVQNKMNTLQRTR